MTKILLPKMLEKKGGVIVNLSSCVAEVSFPMLTIYSATKVTFLLDLLYLEFYMHYVL